jgi:hypothetical protein
LGGIEGITFAKVHVHFDEEFAVLLRKVGTLGNLAAGFRDDLKRPGAALVRDVPDRDYQLGKL